MLMHLAQSACKSAQEAIQAAKQAVVQKEEEHSQVCLELQQLKNNSSLPPSWQEVRPEAVSTSMKDHIDISGMLQHRELVVPTCLLPHHILQSGNDIASWCLTTLSVKEI